MLILSQSKARIINMDQMAEIVTYACEILAFTIPLDNDKYIVLGSYETEDRCKQIMKEIFDSPETYIMPKE